MDRGDRAPEIVVVLGACHRDVAVRQCHIQQGEQPRVVPLVQSLVSRDRPGNAAPLQRGTFEPEQRDLCLVLCASAGCLLAITTKRSSPHSNQS